MELIQTKILLEDSRDRRYNSPTYGNITATTFNIPVFLTQDIDDMGLFTDAMYIPNTGIGQTPDYSVLTSKLLLLGIVFPFMFGTYPFSSETQTNLLTRITGKTQSDYYNFGNEIITGETSNNLDLVKSYNNSIPYILGFNINRTNYTDYLGNPITGITRVTNINNGEITYVVDTNETDINIGTFNQNSGFLFKSTTGSTTSSFMFLGQGLNQTNISLSAFTKEEYLIGIISNPKIENDVFISRGKTSVNEKHLKLSEIRNIEDLVKYGGGFYGVNQ